MVSERGSQDEKQKVHGASQEKRMTRLCTVQVNQAYRVEGGTGRRDNVKHTFDIELDGDIQHDWSLFVTELRLSRNRSASGYYTTRGNVKAEMKATIRVVLLDFHSSKKSLKAEPHSRSV